MSDSIISVEGLGKRYRISHQGRKQSYVALRDVIAQKLKAPFQFLRRSQKSEVSGQTSDLRPPNSGKSSEDFWALKDVSFDVNQGEVVGIIGRNGAGKSTLLKILSRITEPTEGRVHIKGRVASLLEVGTGFHNELTGRENIFLNGAILGMHRAEIKRKFDEIVAFSEVEKFLDTPVKRYSSGMYVRLAFAVAAHLEPEILIVDEVLAVGDAEFQKKCLGKMQDVSQKEGRTVLFVSHNMGAMLNLCTRGVVLNCGKIAFNGRIEEAVDSYNQKTAELHAGEKGWEPHVVYQFDDQDQAPGEFEITKVELLDESEKPKPVVYTWDSFKVRIHYSVSRRIEIGSVDLQFATLDGVPLLCLSTRPLGTLQMSLEVGDHFVDCHLKDLPFAAGEFQVGAGLAIPQVEMLCWKPKLGILTIHPKDVYSSGVAPALNRSFLAINHSWTKK
jgi:lipopolysaccharide transport system ATP-binding protein